MWVAAKPKANTDTESYHLDGELVARTRKNRYTLGAEFNLTRDKGEETVNNALGYTKYDHFLAKKWYLYSNAIFTKDKFQDLYLRTFLGLGLGYQFLEEPLVNLSTEAGLGYVNEDFIEAEDERYSSGRWAVNFDKYLLVKTVQFFHFHEGLVGLEDTDDVLIRSRTGFRFPLKDFNATIQLNYDWDRSPAEDRKNIDITYLFTIGYQW